MISPNDPSWILKDPGSFASIHVKLPPGKSVNCESDAVVTFSQGVQVRGVMSGGFFASLARLFLTRESFFTTVAENTNLESVADVMLAPNDPGGIVLHRLNGHVIGADDDDLFLTSGAYIASDTYVKVSSQVQTAIGKSLLSGTGFFLLKATGSGYVACGGYGSIHKFVLKPSEVRVVDNGHLVAWSASMKYSVGLVGGRGGVGRRLWNSATSGEGLMCHFEGPGVIYLQSHKADGSGSSNTRIQKGRGGKKYGSCAKKIFGALLGAGLWWSVLFLLQIQMEILLEEERNDVNIRQWHDQHQEHQHEQPLNIGHGEF